MTELEHHEETLEEQMAEIARDAAAGVIELLEIAVTSYPKLSTEEIVQSTISGCGGVPSGYTHETLLAKAQATRKEWDDVVGKATSRLSTVALPQGKTPPSAPYPRSPFGSYPASKK